MKKEYYIERNFIILIIIKKFIGEFEIEEIFEDEFDIESYFVEDYLNRGYVIGMSSLRIGFDIFSMTIEVLIFLSILLFNGIEFDIFIIFCEKDKEKELVVIKSEEFYCSIVILVGVKFENFVCLIIYLVELYEIDEEVECKEFLIYCKVEVEKFVLFMVFCKEEIDYISDSFFIILYIMFENVELFILFIIVYKDEKGREFYYVIVICWEEEVVFIECEIE